MKSVQMDCLVCGKEIDVEIPKEIPFNEQFNDYEPLQVICPHCEEEGQQTINFLNMSLPLSEYDPEELENEIYFTEREKKNRKAAREIMWRARKDLRGKARAEYERERVFKTEKKFGKNIEQIRQENQRIKHLEFNNGHG